jgi:sorting nexin-1/2
VEKGKDEFEKISKAIRKEVARFDKYRVEDFKDSVVSYLEQMMENQQRVGIVSLREPAKGKYCHTG